MAKKHEVFPLEISQMSSQAIYKTTITEGANWTSEVRNQEWQDPRHRFDCAFTIRTFEDAENLRKFFHTVKGRAHSFLLEFKGDYAVKTWTDITNYSSNDAVDGTLQTWNLFKEYPYTINASTEYTYQQITRVEPNTVELRDNSVEKTYTATNPPASGKFYVNGETGEIRYEAGAGGNTVEIKIAKYWTLVRFDSDEEPRMDFLHYWLNGSTDVANVQPDPITFLQVSDS